MWKSNPEDTLDGYGRADLAVTSRIRNGWKKIQQIMPFLTSSALAQVYVSCVRSRMSYGDDTRLLLADVGLMFEKADMQNFNSLSQHQL